MGGMVPEQLAWLRANRIGGFSESVRTDLPTRAPAANFPIPPISGSLALGLRPREGGRMNPE